MSGSLTAERFDELVLAYFEETARPEEVEELGCMLSADDAALGRFVRRAKVHAGLTKLAKGENVLLGPLDGDARRSTVRTYYWGALAASVALLLGVAYMAYRGSRDPSAPYLHAVSKHAVLTRDGKPLESEKGMTLRPGDVLESTGEGDIIIVYPGEDTRVEVSSDSRLRLEDAASGKTLYLARGGLRAEVAAQSRGRHVAVTTPHAEVRVTGTIFRMRVTREWTGVEVEKGAVRARTRKKDEPVEITEGYSGLTGEGGKIDVAAMPPRLPAVPDEERARLLAVETPAQKELRAELAQFGARGQRVAFCNNTDGVQRVYTMKPDGSDVRCVTPSPGPGGFNPHVSPDGGRAVFENRIDPKLGGTLPADPRYRKRWDLAVYLADITGDGRRPLTVGGAPHWSPDGRRIIYHYPRPGEGGWRVGVFDTDSGTERALDGIPSGGRDPCFSADGSHVIVSAKSAFFVAAVDTNADGVTEVTGVTTFNHLKGIDAEVSSDGRWLVWVQGTHKSMGSWIYYASMGTDGSIGPGISLPLGWGKEASVNYHPDFSPSGKYLVYAHAKADPDVRSWSHGSKQELYVTRFPSCDVTVRITWNNGSNRHPQWWGQEFLR